MKQKSRHRAVRNNPDKFLEGFAWELDGDEMVSLRSVFLTLENNPGRDHHSKCGYIVFAERVLGDNGDKSYRGIA